jgi:hypothetical protein
MPKTLLALLALLRIKETKAIRVGRPISRFII